MEFFVQVLDERGCGIREHDATSSGIKPFEEHRELFLVSLVKRIGGVARKNGSLAQRGIGRIQVYEVASGGKLANVAVISDIDDLSSKRAMGGQERLPLRQGGVLGLSRWGIELAPRIHSVKPVVASLIQEDRPRGALGGAQRCWILAPNPFEMFFVGSFRVVPVERNHELARMIANCPECVDKFLIDVREDCPFG